jgi:DNA repair photolyase
MQLCYYSIRIMIVREIQSKTILSESKVYPYVINPYVGCQHACSYCYARFMKRFTGHREPWGDFVDVKINAPDLLKREIKRKTVGKVWVSGVCDPYQPIEAKYKLTSRCLEILAQNNRPVVIQTRSPLVLRDIDIIRSAQDFEVGFSITTADDDIRKMFEPKAPPIKDRIKALDELHKAGVRTFTMIAPILPGAQSLPGILEGKVDYILVDRMNYNHANWIYKKFGMGNKHTDDYFLQTGNELDSACNKLGISCEVIC